MVAAQPVEVAMAIKLSADGNRLTLDLSRPWIQGFVGLVFAGAGTVALVLVARGELDQVKAGVRIPLPQLASCGIAIIGGFFVVLGLSVALYRRGTVLDRQEGEAVQWQGLPLMMSSVRRRIRRFVTVRLESAIREGPRDKDDRRHFYRMYYVKLVDPKGSELPLGSLGSSDVENRAAAQKIAEFLKLSFVDLTTKDAPLPASAGQWRASIDVAGLGPLSVQSEPPPVPELTPYEYRECQEQPEDSVVRVEQYAEGVTLTVPAAGILQGSKGLFAFGVIWTVVVSAIGLIIVGFMQQDGTYHKGMLAGLAFFELIGLLLLAGGIQMGRRQAVLAVVADRLMLLQTGPLRRTRREWPRDQLTDVCTGPSGMSVGGEPVIELQVIPRDGKKCGVLGGRDEEELRWLATLLRRALRFGPENGEPAVSS